MPDVAAAGDHWHLAAALTAAGPRDGQALGPDTVLDRLLTRILTGLLQPLNVCESRS